MQAFVLTCSAHQVPNRSSIGQPCLIYVSVDVPLYLQIINKQFSPFQTWLVSLCYVAGRQLHPLNYPVNHPTSHIK
jgi:hypothetical protein